MFLKSDLDLLSSLLVGAVTMMQSISWQFLFLSPYSSTMEQQRWVTQSCYCSLSTLHPCHQLFLVAHDGWIFAPLCVNCVDIRTEKVSLDPLLLPWLDVVGPARRANLGLWLSTAFIAYLSWWVLLAFALLNGGFCYWLIPFVFAFSYPRSISLFYCCLSHNSFRRSDQNKKAKHKKRKIFCNIHQHQNLHTVRLSKNKYKV